MTDKLFMTPIIGWALFDKSLASITDNHGNRASAWSTTCANGHQEGYVVNFDKVALEQQIKAAGFKDLVGVMTGTVDLGEMPSPIHSYCAAAKDRASPSRN